MFFTQYKENSISLITEKKCGKIAVFPICGKNVYCPSDEGFFLFFESFLKNFFVVPEQLMELKQTVQSEYIQRFEQSRAGLTHIVSTRNIFLLDMDFQAPKIIIPGPDGQLITVNFGRLYVTSNKSKLNSILDFNQSEYQIDQLQELAYSDYDAKLDNLEVTVSRSRLSAD